MYKELLKRIQSHNQWVMFGTLLSQRKLTTDEIKSIERRLDGCTKI